MTAVHGFAFGLLAFSDADVYGIFRSVIKLTREDRQTNEGKMEWRDAGRK
jgi:hypothetical protein